LNSAHPKSDIRSVGTNVLSLAGTDANSALHFDSRIKVLTSGGSVINNGGFIEVKNADSAVLFVTLATGSRRFRDRPSQLAARSAKALEQVTQRPIETILAEHFTAVQKRNLGKLR
jgi:alpha-L-fucosidase 2